MKQFARYDKFNDKFIVNITGLKTAYQIAECFIDFLSNEKAYDEVKRFYIDLHKKSMIGHCIELIKNHLKIAE